MASIGTFKAPKAFKGKAVFEVKIKMRLRFVEKTNYFFVVDMETKDLDYNFSEKFVVDFNQ